MNKECTHCKRSAACLPLGKLDFFKKFYRIERIKRNIRTACPTEAEFYHYRNNKTVKRRLRNRVYWKGNKAAEFEGYADAYQAVCKPCACNPPLCVVIVERGNGGFVNFRVSFSLEQKNG